ncbi:MAG: AAA family ATPase [Planctomycetota bacterium]|jgi:predicted ATP-dependent protease
MSKPKPRTAAKSPSKRRNSRRLRASELRWTCPAAWIPTEKKRPAKRKIADLLYGQDRAMEAIHMGLGVDAPGYNVFVCGIGGTDRALVMQQLLEELKLSCGLPHDHVFVHNFENPMEPRHLRFAPGGGAALVEGMGRWVHALSTDIQKLLKDEKHVQRRQRLFSRYQKAEQQLLRRLQGKLRKAGLALVTVENEEGTRHDVHYILEDGLTSPEDAAGLPRGKRPAAKVLEKLAKAREEQLPQIDVVRKKSRALGLRLLRESSNLDERVVQEAVEGLTLALAEELDADLALAAWLGDCAHFALNHSHLFLGTEENEEETKGGRPGLEVFQVNPVRTLRAPDCPIIYEPHPNYSNLFGTVERTRMQSGPGHVHLAVRPGAILSADGGYLVLDARDIFKEAEVWRALKRTLQTGEVAVHALENLSPLGVTGARPQPIPVQLKVVLVGDAGLYEALHDDDFDFNRIFKVKAELDDSLVLDKKTVEQVVLGLMDVARKENLVKPARSGLRALVERGVRAAGRRGRITSQLPQMCDYLRESSYQARKAGKRSIQAEAVEAARVMFRDQHALDAEWYQRHLLDGTYRIDTDGRKVGEVNALTVVTLGPLGFGRPARISAMVAAGDEAYTNLDREVDLAGNIHNKGMLMVENFMRWCFGQKRCLPARMSLVFDQNYGPIDGDSASCAELFALLSALTDMPLRQDLAVTGALSMRGEVLAVGGVNEKIEGFFDLCQARGFTGEQGALIPAITVEDLMLPEKVVDAVRAGEFHIHAVDNVEQAVAQLFERPAAEVFRAVEKRLDELDKEGKDEKSATEDKEEGKGSST